MAETIARVVASSSTSKILTSTNGGFPTVTLSMLLINLAGLDLKPQHKSLVLYIYQKKVTSIVNIIQGVFFFFFVGGNTIQGVTAIYKEYR